MAASQQINYREQVLRQRLATLVPALPFGFGNSAFLGLDRLIPDMKRKTIAMHLDRPVTSWHVKDHHFVVLVRHHEPLGLWRIQAGSRCAQQRCQRFCRQVVSRHCAVVLNAEQRHTAVGTGKGSHVFGRFFANLLTVSMLLLPCRPLSHGFAHEVLALKPQI